MTIPGTVNSPHAIRYRGGKQEETGIQVIVETNVSLSVNGEKWLTFMCTPTHIAELAAGFLFNEGVIDSSEEIAVVEVCPTGENVDIWLKFTPQQPKQWRRTTGCTGGATAVEQEPDYPVLADGIVLSPMQVENLIKDLKETQVLYKHAGGVHSSILSDGTHVVVSAEDVGRHNTLDKIAGICLMNKVSMQHKVLVTTGRVSSDMIQKAARIGTAVVISRTSATSLSVSLAEKWGITLIGYARPGQFIVYTHPERMDLSGPGGLAASEKRAFPHDVTAE